MKKLIYLSFLLLNITFSKAQNIDNILPDNEILIRMYPNAKVENATAEWAGGNEEGENKILKSIVYYKEFYVHDNSLKCLVFTSSNYQYNDCHRCSALLGGAVLKKESETWIIEAINKEITWQGIYGRISGFFETIKLSEQIKGIKITNNTMWTGIVGSDICIISIMNNKINLILDNITVELNNSGTLECGSKQICWGYTSKIKFSMGINHFLYFAEHKKESNVPYDIIQTTNGTFINTEITPYNKIIVYQFKDGKYKKISEKDIEN